MGGMSAESAAGLRSALGWQRNGALAQLLRGLRVHGGLANRRRHGAQHLGRDVFDLQRLAPLVAVRGGSEGRQARRARAALLISMCRHLLHLLSARTRASERRQDLEAPQLRNLGGSQPHSHRFLGCAHRRSIRASGDSAAPAAGSTRTFQVREDRVSNGSDALHTRLLVHARLVYAALDRHGRYGKQNVAVVLDVL
jgi:hypothetical protein